MTLGLELGAGGSLEPQAVVELFVMSRRWQVELVTGQVEEGMCRGSAGRMERTGAWRQIALVGQSTVKNNELGREITKLFKKFKKVVESYFSPHPSGCT